MRNHRRMWHRDFRGHNDGTAPAPALGQGAAGGAEDNSTADSGTDHNLQTLLLPHLNDGWRSP